MLTSYIRLLRPKQWLKNLFVFAGLIFTGNILNFPLLSIVFLGFVLFCFASSGVYIFNDILDLEEDRRHPLKAKRPLASGEIKISSAVILGFLLLIVSLLGGFLVNTFFSFCLLTYVVVNLIYSKYLKHVVIIDVLIVAFGFVIRAASGGIAINVAISPWLLICTTLLALFIVIGKRRHELVLLGGEARQHRKILAEYSQQMLDQMIAVVTSSTVMAYALYTFTAHKMNYYLMITVPFVLYGVFRYLYIVYSRSEAGSPEEVLLKDKPLLFDVLVWAVACAVIMYFFQN